MASKLLRDLKLDNKIVYQVIRLILQGRNRGIDIQLQLVQTKQRVIHSLFCLYILENKIFESRNFLEVCTV